MRHLLASTLYLSTALSCGVLVHNEALHRATHLFALPNSVPDLTQLTPLISPLLLSPSNAPSLQSGAFFPDWGYQCLSTDADAEAAHWPPFLVAAVEHVIAKYGHLNETRSDPEQQHLERLISFVFAVAAHQTQDASWHAIRMPGGFLAALSAVDFGGDVDKAHRVLDFGGDWVLADRLARIKGGAGWLSGEWKVPVEDIIEIYSRMGRSVNRFVVRYCAMRGLAALRSDLAVGPSLVDSMASQSPMLVTALDSYHLGGLDEMTSRTVSCWSNLTRWFAYGIDADEKIRNGWGICDLFRAIKARGGAGDTGHSHSHQAPKHPEIAEHAEKELGSIVVTTDGFGAETYTLPPLASLDRPKPPALARPNEKAPKFEPPTWVATYTPYGRFGSSISVGPFAAGGGQALAIGAPTESEDSSRPGEGNVYVLPLADVLSSSPAPFSAAIPEQVAPERIAQTTTTTSRSVDQRFGTASTPWRALGQTLLAVSAPGPLSYEASSPSLPFSETAMAGKIDVFRPGEAIRWLGVSIRGAELGGIGRRWWGEKMIAADLDGSGNEWLVVGGARSDGRRVCEGHERIQVGEGEVGLFQLAPSAGAAAEGGDIEVDMHMAAAEAGTLKTMHVPLPPSEKEQIPCGETSTFDAFGSALSFLPKTKKLLIASAAKTFAYSLAADNSTLELAWALPSSSSSRISALTAGVHKGTEWFAVGVMDEEVDGQVQAGVVRVYTVAATTPRLVAEIIAEDDSDERDGRSRRYGKFGQTLVADPSSGGLWVGSDRWDGERGAVWWVDVDSLVSSSTQFSSSISSYWQRTQQLFGGGGAEETEVKRRVVGFLMKGEEVGGRFGSDIAVVEGEEGEKGGLAVGVPYAGVGREEQEERFYGAVGVWKRV